MRCKYQQNDKKSSKKIIEEQSTKINDKQIFIKENDCEKNLL